MALRDIRDHFPKTPQTDPNKFPAYKYQAYPRMMTKIVGDKKVPYKDASGNPVIVNNATEEAQFKVKHEGAVDVEEPKATVASIAAHEPENVNTLIEKRKPGRPAKPKLPEPLPA
jgi:hypothetical protein